MNNIILLATYWNEKDFVSASLEQIDKIDPLEVIICDGCFDPKKRIHSTDGTYEILKKYVKQRRNEGKQIRLISPQRRSLIGAFFSLLRMNMKTSVFSILRPARWRIIRHGICAHAYRRNQAITFNYMIGISKYWKPGRWVMMYDSDQFYSDKLIKNFKNACEKDGLGLITAKELTFFNSFSEYTEEYEKRQWNNLPHRIYSNTVLIPTRNMFIETFFSFKEYSSTVLKQYCGNYFHYKLPRGNRYAESYSVGDRKRPLLRKYMFKRFTGKHPLVIRNHFEKQIWRDMKQ